MLPMDAEDGSDCSWWQWDCKMSDFGATLAGDAVENLAAAVLEAVLVGVNVLATSWVYVGTPDLTSGDGMSGGMATGNVNTGTPSGATQVETLLGYAVWISLGVCVLALITLGATMAINQRRGEGSGTLSKIGLVLFATVLISGAAGIVSGVLPSTGPADSSRPVSFLQSHLWWFMGAAALMSVIAGSVRMVWEQRADPGKELIKSLITLVVVTGGGVAIIGAAVSAADAFSVWIIDSSVDADFYDAMGEMLQLGGLDGLTGAFLVMFVGIFVLFFALLQIVLMIIRVGMIVILAGIFPLAASFTNTEMGKTWFKKCLGWLIAFVLYKPAAAIIYATAFQITGSSVFGEEDEYGMLSALVGITMMLVSLIAMPALMKFVAPMASMGGGGIGGTVAGVAGLVGGKLASGAVQKGQESSDSATSDPGGSAPSGSDSTGGEHSSPDPEGAPSSDAASSPTGDGEGETSSPPTGPTGGEEGGELAESSGTEAAAGATPVGAVAGELADRVEGAKEGISNDFGGTVDDATGSHDGD